MNTKNIDPYAGKNLTILISTNPELDWQTFSCWYSFNKNLPLAHIFICCIRNGQTPFQLFQWAKRLKIKVFFSNLTQTETHHKVYELLWSYISIQKYCQNNSVLITTPYIMAVEKLDKTQYDKMIENKEYVEIKENYIILKKQKLENILNDIILNENIRFSTNTTIPEAKEKTNITPIISYKKGCGKWIDKLRGCPFSCVNGLKKDIMTVNELRIMNLWQQMCSLYNAVK